MVMAGSTKERIAAVDKFSTSLQNEVITAQTSDEGVRDGHLFKKISQSIDFAGPFVFSGFGELGSGAAFMKKIEKQESKS
jgi:hypothetical protein